mmetsp:Transcript_18091/g.41684  ORF Transcript_18091/g.41684 Transcript_18091/m.41684 type:complete len:81 (-) Transcript_18091:2015-2257(-)
MFWCVSVSASPGLRRRIGTAVSKSWLWYPDHRPDAPPLGGLLVFVDDECGGHAPAFISGLFQRGLVQKSSPSSPMMSSVQ